MYSRWPACFQVSVMPFRCAQTRRLVALLALVTGVMAFVTSAFGAVQSALPEFDHPVRSGLLEPQAAPEQPAAQPTASIEGFLDAEGRLALPADFSGSLDPAGFEMMLGQDGSPRFLPHGGPADPDERWDDQFFLDGCDGMVYAIAQGPGGELYIGGDFPSCGGMTVNNVARFDPDTGNWSALSSGVNNAVLALVVSGTNLYVGGQFNAVGSLTASRIARWDGNNWSVLGSDDGNGVNGVVRVLTEFDGDLYVGGDFTQANIAPGVAISANHIVRWDGSAWSALGSGMDNGVNNEVSALTVSGSDLYVGGSFTGATAGAATIAANRIARWNGSTWSALGSGGGNGLNSTVRTLAVSGDDLYVGGHFTDANVGGAEITANRIARWNGSMWSALGSSEGNGVNNIVRALAVSGTDLYVGGDFTAANAGAAEITANRIAHWNGSTWSALDSGGGNGVNSTVRALTASGSDLYLGGWFIEANIGAAIGVNRIARWDGSTWSVLGSSGGKGVNDTVRALAVSGNDLYVGGSFTAVGGIAANRVARWDGSAWSALGSGAGNGVNGSVYALAMSGSDLYVAGIFTQANVGDGISASRVARWNGSNWSALGSDGGNGLNGPVYALAVSESDLYVGGSFTEANVGDEITTNRIAHWDGSAWSALGSDGGNGVNDWVWALAVSGTNLHVGGDFTAANAGAAEITANRIAHWNGSTWSALGAGGGDGLNGRVNALAVSGSDLYVGGWFSEANVGDAIVANRIALWDGSAWSALGSGAGNGVNSVVLALAVSGSDLYVGGHFSQANIGAAINANRIARWNGSDWSALGGGTNLAVQAIDLTDPDTLYAGGDFSMAGDKPSNRIGRYTARGTLEVALAGTGSGNVSSDPPGLACTGTCSENFAWDQFITLTATADSGSEFVGWSGGACSGTAPCVVDFDQDTSVTAEFELITYTIGGTVSGLAPGNNVILQNNDTDDLTVSANSDFTFTTALPDDSNYNVTVLTQPSDPNQTCVVDHASGTVTGTDIDDVEVTCITDTYTVTTTAVNGSITSAVNPEIEHGETTTVTGEADANQYFASVSGCGGIEQTNTDQSVTDFSYDTGPIEEACTVEAVFASLSYSISVADIQGEGSIDILTPQVDHGSDAEFEVAPDAGWSLESFTGDACTPTDNGGGTWTAENITEDCAVEAAFVEDTENSLTSSMMPAFVDESVTYTITVTATASAPTDGQIELSSDSDGIICTITSADSTSGNTATFTCQHAWIETGSHELTATFSGSANHGDSSDQLIQQIVAGEHLFQDRFEADP